MDLRDVADALAVEPRSGQQLAGQFGVSRAALWKAIEQLRELGLPVRAVAGSGYRLDARPEWLHAESIRAELSTAARSALAGLELAFAIDSTNAQLLRRAPELPAPFALLAEHQSAGRGRRGRQWSSPLAANIYLSLLFKSQRGIAGLAGLALACGVAVAQALESLGVARVQLKWPNDILVDGRKIGGILIEASGEFSGPCQAVIGVGLNWQMPREAAGAIEQDWTDLAAACPQGLPSRNRTAAALIDALIAMFGRFSAAGLAGFAGEFERRDALRGCQVSVAGEGEQQVGTYCGIDTQGNLRLAADAGERVLVAGEVSVRKVRG